MRALAGTLFALCFLPILLAFRLATALLRGARFSGFLAWLHRRLGLRNRVLFLEMLYPETAGFEYRVRRWMEVLDASGFVTRARYAIGAGEADRLLAAGRLPEFHLRYLLRRIPQCVSAVCYSCVVVRRELLRFNGYGNLFLDRFLLAIHPNVVLDFDDDLGADWGEPRPLTLFGRLMCEAPARFRTSLRLYSRFMVGNTVLGHLAQAANLGRAVEVAVVPTCVHYASLPGKSYETDQDPTTFGWIGTSGNLSFLDLVVPALARLARRCHVRLLVISSIDYEANAELEIVSRRWGLATEVEDLLQVDLGLMPLKDGAVERGKCGFKLLQYMGLGIVSIASAVGVNREIVEDGKNGFLVPADGDWDEALQRVLDRRPEFGAIGKAARDTVRSRYSYEANRAVIQAFLASR